MNLHTEMTEEELRDFQAGTPATIGELMGQLETLQIIGNTDYGNAVYAMSIAAQLTYNFMASSVGATGFQAGVADLDFVRRARGLKGPFMLVDAAKATFPQYDLRKDVDEFLKESEPWISEECGRKLAEYQNEGYPIAQSVMEHWIKLAPKGPKGREE